MFDILDLVQDVKVIVLGDVMLDRYWWGDVTRISPEAPVPVVRLKNSTVALGGAANVAANIAGLGGIPLLLGCIGKDSEGALFPDLCRDIFISSDHLIAFSGRPTTVKTRIIAHSQQVARVDQEDARPLDTQEQREVIDRAMKLLDVADAIAISDYAKGFLTEKVLATIISGARIKDIPVVVDPKGRDYSKYRAASLITPNRREAAEACNLDDDGKQVVAVAGNRLMSDLGFDSVLITEGEEGMTLFSSRAEPVHMHATAREVYDVTGAGDTVLAAMTLALAAGSELSDAARVANAAAGLAVEKVGTSIVTSAMLRRLQSPGELRAGK